MSPVIKPFQILKFLDMIKDSKFLCCRVLQQDNARPDSRDDVGRIIKIW